MDTSDSLLRLDPKPLEKASLAINQGRIQHAVDLLQKTLRMYWYAGDMRAQAHHLLGICFYKQGAYLEAMQHYIVAFYMVEPIERPGARGAIVRDMSQIFLAMADLVSADEAPIDYVRLAEAACLDSLEIFAEEEASYFTLLKEVESPEKKVEQEALAILKAEIGATTGFLARIAFELRDKKRARKIFCDADQLLREANSRTYELNNRVAFMKASNCLGAFGLAWRAYKCALSTRSWLRLGQITVLWIPIVRWFFLK